MEERARAAGCRLAVAVLASLVLSAAGAAQAGGQERAYELVSPSGVDANLRFGNGVVTPDGDYACYHSESAYLGAFSSGLVTADIGYCARRGPTGWVSEWVTAPKPAGDILAGTGAQVTHVSPDGARVVFVTGMGLFREWESEMGRSGAAPASAYMREGGETRWLAPTTDPPRPEGLGGSRHPLGVSEDLRHGVFNSVLGLVATDRNEASDVYAWTPDGIELISADADGNAVGGISPLPSAGASAVQALPNSMSRDGRRIFFLHRDGAIARDAPPGVFSVFMREGDDVLHVSPRRGPGSAADVRFAGATADGSTVYLSTAEQLTNEPKATGDALYRYDIASDELSLVASDPDGIQLLDLSDDGSTLVYTLRNPTAPPLVVRHHDVEAVIGTAVRAADGDTTSLDWGGVLSKRPDKRALRITSDGRVVVFASAGSFAGTTPGVTRVYRWEAGRGVAVVSVDESGDPVTADARITNWSTISPLERIRNNVFLAGLRFNPNVGRVMSDDGSRVFFETTQRLVPGDVNDVLDVYEWHDGRVQLVSPGTQGTHARYHDNSADGRTVFFTTASRLIPELDRNGSRDLYAARIGGGFPLPLPPATCSGDGCQAETPPRPDVPVAASDVFKGPGDAVDPAPPVARHRLLRLSRRQLRSLARRGRTTVRVRVSVPGTVRLTAFARIVRRRVRVARGRSAALRAGVIRIPLRLSTRARLQLKERGRLRLRLRAAFSEVDGVVGKGVTLRG